MRGLPLLGLALLGTMSYAQDDSYAYVGFGVGVFDYSVELFNQSFLVTISDDTDATKLYGGWKVNERMAVEGSYGQTGELQWTGSILVDNSNGVLGPNPRPSLDAVARADWAITTVSVPPPAPNPTYAYESSWA